jgi:hypothetical protein
MVMILILLEVPLEFKHHLEICESKVNQRVFYFYQDISLVKQRSFDDNVVAWKVISQH